MQPPPPPVDWNSIAAFYAQKPTTVAFPDVKPGAGAWGPGMSGNVHQGVANLSPEVKAALGRWYKQRNSKAGAVLGTYALGTLLHEVLHTRDDQPGTGFNDWQEDEDQARALGFELVPDLMQRFFGVKIGSKVGREYEAVARKLANDYVYNRKRKES